MIPQDSAGKGRKKKTTLSLTAAMWTYVKNSPLWGLVFIFTFVIFLACQTSRQISDWWLRQWTSDARVWCVWLPSALQLVIWNGPARS